jgi:hypothetical protein
MREVSGFLLTLLVLVAFFFLSLGVAFGGETPKPFADSSVREIVSDTSVSVADETLVVVTASPVRITLPRAGARLGRTVTIVSARAEYSPYDGSGVELAPQPGERVEGAPNDWATVYGFGFGSRVVRAVSATEWRVVAGW